MRGTNWTPSIVPADGEDGVYLMADISGISAARGENRTMTPQIWRPSSSAFFRASTAIRVVAFIRPYAGPKMYQGTLPKNCDGAATSKCASLLQRYRSTGSPAINSAAGLMRRVLDLEGVA